MTLLSQKKITTAPMDHVSVFDSFVGGGQPPVVARDDDLCLRDGAATRVWMALSAHRSAARRDVVETARQPGLERRGEPKVGQPGGMARGQRRWRWWPSLAARDRGVFYFSEG